MADSFNDRLQLSDEEQHIFRSLRAIADELDNDPQINRIISGVAAGSVAQSPSSVLTQLIREFVALAVSTTKVSAKMVEKIVRIFILMWQGQELSEKVLQEFYPGTSVDNPDSDMVDHMSVYIPQEVTLMDDEFIKKYQEVLKNGQQNVRSIRLMIVGMFGIGKTTLVENLVDRDDSSQEKKIESTVGIDVTHCKIRDGRWIEDIFDNNLNDRFLEMMHNQDIPVPPVDCVDAGVGSFTSGGEQQINIPDESGDMEIIYERTSHVEESEDLKSSSIEESDKETEEFKKKLTREDDPELQTLKNEYLRSAKEPYNSLDSTISIWDFAGQYIYYSTHHFFLNSRSIYLLMMDISNPLTSIVKEESDFPLSGFIPKDFTCLEAFKFWLNSIHMYSTQRETDVKPSVILVGTKKDKLEGTDEDKEKQKDDYFDEALKSLSGSPALKHVHRKKFLINNLDDNEDFGKIRKEVECLAKQQRYWGEVRPAKWISLERKFLGLKSEGKEIITFDDVKNVDSKSEMPIVDDDELRFFLKFQHSLGNILYYETPLLMNYVILSPQWIIDAFRCFITHVKDKDPQQLKDWENYEKKAILTQELIDEILDHTEVNKYFRGYKKQVIEYMEHLDMIAKPIDAAICDQLIRSSTSACQERQRNVNSCGDFKTGGIQHQLGCNSNDLLSTGQVQEMEQLGMKHVVDLPKDTVQEKSASPVNFYIVPSLLKLRPELNEISQLTSPPDCKVKTPVLCFKFINKFMPPSVFHRLLAVCIRKWTIVVTNNCNQKTLLFNGFAVFYVTETKTTTLSLWFQDNIIYARVSFYSKVDESQAQAIKWFLVKHLDEILRILPNESRIIEEMPYEEYIQCSRIQEFKADTGLLRMTDFFLCGEVMCDCTPHLVEKDEGIKLWCYDSVKKQQSPSIPDAMLKRQPTAKELSRLAKAIGNKYSRLREVLNIETALLHHIEDIDRFHLQTRIYHLLCKWNKSDNTIEQLRNAMMAVDCDIDCFDNVIQNDQFQIIELNKSEGIDFDRKPRDEELASLADKIGHESWLLGVELGIPEVRLEQLREDNVCLPKFVYYMLLEWNKGDSNIEYLGKAMLLVGSDMNGFYEVFTKEHMCE